MHATLEPAREHVPDVPGGGRSPGLPPAPRPSGTPSDDTRADVHFDFRLRVARTAQCESRAAALLRDRYGWRGYDTAALDAQGRAGTVLLAASADAVVGTLTVRANRECLLGADALYARELDGLRGRARHVCEFTRFAVDPWQRSKALLATLFHAGLLVARRQWGASDLVIEVNPRHVRFYQRMLGFRRAGPLRFNDRVGAPAVLLHLELETAERRVRGCAGTRGEPTAERSLYPWFLGPAGEQRLLNDLGLMADRTPDPRRTH